MAKKELTRLSKDQLVKACRNQGLDTSGEKAALADRLAEPEESAPEEKVSEEPEAPETEPEVD